MKVSKDVHWVGVLDPDLEMFDVIVPTEWGTTYNSYLIKAEKPALVDTVKANFDQEFFAKLTAEIDLSELQYLIVNHTEPDHAGCIGQLLEKAPHITVYASRPAIQFLKEQVNREFKYQIVQDNDTLSLGNKTLRFVMAPFLHWPDTMFTYLEEEKLLFTCDGFGCHYCDKEQGRMFESEVEDFTPAISHYYEFIMSPFKPKVLEAVQKVQELQIDAICTGHGPILDKDPWRVVSLYQRWSEDQANHAIKRVALAYVSAYGHTRQMAELIAKGLKTTDKVRVDLMDLAELTEEEMREKLNDFDGIILGSPTINADAVEPVWRGVSHLSAITAKGKLAAVFGNYGWSGEAVQLLEERLAKMRLAIAQPGLRVKFGLTDQDREDCITFGRSFAEALTLSDK